MGDFFPPVHWTNLLIIPGMLLGFIVHDLAHAFTAYYLGDNSQVERGKFTLSPLRHISWFGTFAFILLGIGWAKPLDVDSKSFKRKHLDTFLVALAGPVASFTFGLIGLMLTLTISAALVYVSGVSTDQIFLLLLPADPELPQTLNLQAATMAFTTYLAAANFGILLTSLFPLPGLDGFIIISSLVSYLSERRRSRQDPEPQSVQFKPKPSSTPISQYQRRNNLADVHFKIGAEYHQANKFDDAIARYRQAISNDQRFGPAYVNLGLAYLGKGKRREAIQAFRGAVQYADDQKSQQEAWLQLHQLSEVSPIDQNESDNLAKLGAAPWTDTRPQPNWAGLGFSTGLLLIGSVVVYSYLFTSLVEMLKT